MKIQVEVNTKKQDFYAFQMHHSWGYVWVYVLMALLTVALLVFAGIIYIEWGKIKYTLLFLVLISSGILICWIATSVNKLKMTAVEEENKPVSYYTFSKGGVHCTSDGKECFIEIERLYKIAETRKLFLVFLDKQSAFIIPKRCFKSKADIVIFRENMLFKPKKGNK